MSKNKINLFLSYAREDKKIAEKIYNDLNLFGLNIWYDREAIKIGQKWEEEINYAIEKSTYFLVLLSYHSIMQDSYVQYELSQAIKISEHFPLSRIFIIPVRIDQCTPSQIILRQLNLIDIFPEKKYIQGLGEIIKLILPDFYILRKKPMELSLREAIHTIRKHNFYDDLYNPIGLGLLFHNYKQLEINQTKIVIDENSKLTWQSGGSEEIMPFTEAKLFIKKMNETGFAGCHNWRLPTIEEAMSIVESKINTYNNLHIDRVFNNVQKTIWTSDSAQNEWGPQSNTWYYFVSFEYGCFSFGGIHYLDTYHFVADVYSKSFLKEQDCFVRAVRSGILTIEDVKKNADNRNLPY